MADHSYPWHEPFLEALREYPVLQHACDIAGVNRTTVWRARENDPAFAQEVADAMEAGIDRAEREAFARAVTGWREPVFYQGEQCGEVLKKSDAMLALVLKGRRKSVYADRTEITGADGGALAVKDETTRAARIAHLLEQAQLRKIADDIG